MSAQQNSVLQGAMQALSAGLRASAQKSGVIEHALTKGEFREEELLAALRPHFSARYNLASGIVINADGTQSRQQDVIATDSLLSPAFMSAGGIGVFPIETVVATIQVKSRADLAGISDGVENIASVKRLMDEIQRVGWISDKEGGVGALSTTAKPFGGIFGFASDAEPDALFARYVEENLKLPPADRCNALCVLDAFTVLWAVDSEQGAVELSPPAARAAARFEAGENSLLFFYMALIETLRGYVLPSFDLLAYFRGSDIGGRSFIDLPTTADSPAAE